MTLVSLNPDITEHSTKEPFSVGRAKSGNGRPMYDLIELMFFAYRDFVGDADHLLAELGFGRAHHRVLHFVARRPGLTIAELLDILKITKQSLNRVLKELLDQDYVEAQRGTTDRRQRLLYPTARGKALALEVACLQSKRFDGVFSHLPEGGRALAIAFLLAMIDAEGRAKIAAMTGTDPVAACLGPKR